MLSELTQAMIINGIVLTAVLESDLGPHRKITPFRILRPLLTSVSIIPLFIDRPMTHGAGLALEIGATLAGFLCGVAALALMKIYRSPSTGRPASRAGLPYALFWTVVIGARAAFSYGAVNWFPSQLAHWCVTHHVTGAAITDGLIFMAIAMTITRTLGMAGRALQLPTAPAASSVATARS